MCMSEKNSAPSEATQTGPSRKSKPPWTMVAVRADGSGSPYGPEPAHGPGGGSVAPPSMPALLPASSSPPPVPASAPPAPAAAPAPPPEPPRGDCTPAEPPAFPAPDRPAPAPAPAPGAAEP